MSDTLKELEKQARALSTEEKAALVRTLIAELDAGADPDADQLWIREAQQRYDAYVAGKLAASPGDKVMKRARSRLK